MASISNSVHLDCSWETSYSQPFVPTWSAVLHVPQGNAAGQCYHLFFFFYFMKRRNDRCSSSTNVDIALSDRSRSANTFFFIYYLTRLQSQESKLWSFLAVRVLALSRPEVSASSYKQRTKRERGERRKKNMYSQFRKTARCLDERSSKLRLFKSHDQ